MKRKFSIDSSLQTALSESMFSVENKDKLRVEQILLKNIILDAGNPRQLSLTKEDITEGIAESDIDKPKKLKEKNDLTSLVNSISNHNLINPIVVYKTGEYYKLIAGERRTLASLIAGRTHIEAKILHKKPSPSKFALLQWIENIERKDLSLWERLVNLEKIVQSQSRNIASPTALSSLLGCSKTQAQAYSNMLNNKSPYFRELIKNKAINSIDKASTLSKLDDSELKNLFSDLAQQSLQSINKIVRSNKKKSNRGAKANKIQLGTTKYPQVAKIVFDSLKANEDIKKIMELIELPNDWDSINQINSLFDELIFLLEEKVDCSNE